jgi:hypothetical protein
MAITLILNRKAPPKFQTNLAPNIDILELDAAVHETHEYTNTVTDFPVEKGFSISDHVFKVPEKLTMEGFVTNSPIPYSISNVSELYTSGDRVNTAFETLLDLAGYDPSGQDYTIFKTVKMPAILRIVTGLRVYSNMIITHLSFPRDITTGESLRFTCELRRIITVASETTVINNSSELNGKAVNAGKQSAPKVPKGKQVPVTPPIDKGTTLLNLVNTLGKLGTKIGL